MEEFTVDDVRVTHYGRGYSSYDITLNDFPHPDSDNKIEFAFDETRKLTIMGDTVSLVASDILRLRRFLDYYTTLPDRRE